MKEINLTSSKELYKTAAEIEKNGGKITKIYNQPCPQLLMGQLLSN